ncbi:methyltransferase domain-containing protein [Thalassococcus sp. BH17M4-6]|uniref:methyltransferase domain-containing protein n=1 Tax=Thalassococcus sp. BH17M4-6 TaxID=3413148 RepID=UPI003BD4E1CF
MLQFDAETAALLERAYAGSDVTARRRASFDALRPAGGDTILDIGCGNGLLTREMALAVGDAGRIIGIDPSDQMRDLAVARCADLPWVSIREGVAHDLPVDAGSADKAVSVQVFEYIEDLKEACAAAHRALRPGGRLVVGDMHFDSLAWHSADPDRMARMIAAWDAHFVHRNVPALLPPILRALGFEIEAVTPHTILDTELRPDGLAGMMIILMERFALDKGLMPEDEARAWSAEQKALAQAGAFFFSLTHVVIAARKI